MYNRKGQASIEALLLLAIVFIGLLFIFSMFFQISDSSTALQLTKADLLEKLGSRDSFYALEKMSYVELNEGTEIIISLQITPETHKFTFGDFDGPGKIADIIKQKTKYESVTINPLCVGIPCT
jgi:hypothetical protein